MGDNTNKQASPAPGGPEIRLGCAETLELLPELLVFQELGAAERHIDRLALAHLETCAECRAAAAEVEELYQAMVAGQVPAVPDLPKPDLSFLPPATPRRNWFHDALGRLVIVVSEELLAGLRTGPRTRPGRNRRIYHYEQSPTPGQDLRVSIEVLEEATNTAAGRVVVRVLVPGRDPLDQAGTKVDLLLIGEERHTTTDDVGNAAFAGVPLAAIADMRVVVTPVLSG